MEFHSPDVGGDLMDAVIFLDVASSTFQTTLPYAVAISVPPQGMTVSGPGQPLPFSHKLHATVDDGASECPAARIVEPIRILPARSIRIVDDAGREVFH